MRRRRRSRLSRTIAAAQQHLLHIRRARRSAREPWERVAWISPRRPAAGRRARTLALARVGEKAELPAAELTNSPPPAGRARRRRRGRASNVRLRGATNASPSLRREAGRRRARLRRDDDRRPRAGGGAARPAGAGRAAVRRGGAASAPAAPRRSPPRSAFSLRRSGPKGSAARPSEGLASQRGERLKSAFAARARPQRRARRRPARRRLLSPRLPPPRRLTPVLARRSPRDALGDASGGLRRATRRAAPFQLLGGQRLARSTWRPRSRSEQGLMASLGTPPLAPAVRRQRRAREGEVRNAFDVPRGGAHALGFFAAPRSRSRGPARSGRPHAYVGAKLAAARAASAAFGRSTTQPGGDRSAPPACARSWMTCAIGGG